MFQDNQKALDEESKAEELTSGPKLAVSKPARRKRPSPDVLAAQAEARLLNNVHNILQVRIITRKNCTNAIKIYRSDFFTCT